MVNKSHWDSSILKKGRITISGVNIYCEYLINDKPPLFLIHGFLSSTYTFNRLMPLLKDDFSLISIDLPGFGRSEKSTSFYYSLANYGEIVLECIHRFGLKKVYTAGHSMGGQVALNAAKTAPEKINRQVLLCSSGYLKRANSLLICSSYIPFFNLYVQRYVRKKGVRQSLQNVLYDHSLINDEMITEYKRPLAEKDFYRSLTRLLRHREGDLETEQLAEIETPSLLIWGEEDRVVPLKVGQRLAGELPNAKLVTYEKAGHLITEERPREVSKEIRDFLLNKL